MKKQLFLICLATALGPRHAFAADESVPSLIHQLQSGDDDDKEHAAEVLGNMGAAAAPAVKPLQKLLNDELPYVRVRSAEALAKIGQPALPALLSAMANQNVEVRTIATTALGTVAKGDQVAIAALSKALHDKELQVRGAAALALGNMGTEAESAIPALREAAKDADSSVAEKANEALSRVTPVSVGKTEADIKKPLLLPPPPHVAVVPHAAPKKKPTAVVHPKVVKKPKAAPPPPPPPTPAELIQRLENPDPKVVADAETALVQRSSETTPVLISTLQGSNTTLAEISSDLLTKIATDDAKSAVDAFQKKKLNKKMLSLLRDLRQEGKASEDAAEALVAMGGTAAVPVIPVLQDAKPTSRRAAAKVLDRIGAPSEPATAALITALDDRDNDVRAYSAEALNKINSPDAQKALRFFPVKDKIRRLLSYFVH